MFVGTKITIRGAGLHKPSVMIGKSPCDVVGPESSTAAIVCVTSPSREKFEGTARVTVKIHGIYNAQCREARTLPCGYGAWFCCRQPLLSRALELFIMSSG